MDDEGIKQTGKNLWAVRVKRIEAATGRVKNRKATVVGTKDDARRKRDELRAELASTQMKRLRMRLSEYAASWLELRAADPDMKRSTIRKYGYGLKHIIPVLGDYYLDSISPARVASYIAGRISQVGIKGGNTVLNELRLLRTIAKDSVSEGYAKRYWCERVKPPKVRQYTRERPNLLTGEQFVKLLVKVPRQWLGLLLFMATTGLRWGEASALHWEDVDWKSNEAVIRWGNDRGRLITVKNRSSNRTVPVLPEVAELWGEVRLRGLVFPSRKGTAHKGTPLTKVLNKACKEAFGSGGLRITPHGLRRTFNNLGRQQTSREVLKAITGHSTDAMVEHYSLVAIEEKAAVSRAVAAKIGALGQKTVN